ncbi:MAG: VWA domain-containing protein [Calditrichaceae bacterium]|nr:VWA domain-containing protein [Calditrichaceae bacterium]
MFRFADPWYLLFFLIIPAMGYWYLRSLYRSGGKIRYSDIGILKTLSPSLKQRLRHGLFAIKLIAISLIILALARPQSSSKAEEISTEGVDIMLALDVSSSMLAEDFKPNNRLTAVKLVAKEFVEGRKNDRLGLVIFAGESFTQCPLTLDYGVLITLLDEIKVAEQDWDGTAIGMGIVNAVNRLRDSKAKSKVIILLTDGVNNRGQVDPITAARIAETYNIRIYTIGAGKEGTAMFPVDDPLFGRQYVPRQVQIDEKILKEIAEITNGHYFRAYDENKLKEIYKEIGEMEKTKIEVKEFTRYQEYFVFYITGGLILLILELILSNTYFRKIP